MPLLDAVDNIIRNLDDDFDFATNAAIDAATKRNPYMSEQEIGEEVKKSWPEYLYYKVVSRLTDFGYNLENILQNTVALEKWRSKTRLRMVLAEYQALKQSHDRDRFSSSSTASLLRAPQKKGQSSTVYESFASSTGQSSHLNRLVAENNSNSSSSVNSLQGPFFAPATAQSATLNSASAESDSNSPQPTSQPIVQPPLPVKVAAEVSSNREIIAEAAIAMAKKHRDLRLQTLFFAIMVSQYFKYNGISLDALTQYPQAKTGLGDTLEIYEDFLRGKDCFEKLQSPKQKKPHFWNALSKSKKSSSTSEVEPDMEFEKARTKIEFMMMREGKEILNRVVQELLNNPVTPTILQQYSNDFRSFQPV